MIRAVPSNASDNVYCTLLAQSAVHGAMAGYTGYVSGLVNGRQTYIPFYVSYKNDSNSIDQMVKFPVLSLFLNNSSIVTTNYHHHHVIITVIIIFIAIPSFFDIITIVSIGCDVAEDNGETEQCGGHRQDVGKAAIFDEPAEFLEPQRCLR